MAIPELGKKKNWFTVVIAIFLSQKGNFSYCDRASYVSHANLFRRNALLFPEPTKKISISSTFPPKM